MNDTSFPSFVRALPAAALPFNGLRGWLLQSDSGQVLFNEADTAVAVGEHSHGDQWGIVIDGTIELTIGGRTNTYAQGASYFIPAGTPHSARIFPGFRALDVFADKSRYQVRQPEA
jgi:hypothetical protein